MKKNMLQSKMKQFGDTNESLANAIGISASRFSCKLNGRDGAEFTQGEIDDIKQRYSLTAEEVCDVFFTL